MNDPRRQFGPFTARENNAMAIGIVLVFAALAVPTYPTFLALLTNGEVLSIKQTGLPASTNSLQWSNWRPADGRIQLDEEWSLNADRLRDAKLVAYRTGEAWGLLTKFTFYQARFQLADGSEIVSPARGPERLIGGRRIRMITIETIMIAGAIIFLVKGRCFERTRQNAQRL